jgi:hypothetical protein
MSKVVYGSFAKVGSAEELAGRLNGDAPSGAFAIAHAGGVREEEVQIPATLALQTGIVAALVVGLAAAAIVWSVVFPAYGIMLPVGAFFLIALVGAPFGLVAGVVAGAAECKPALAQQAELASARGLTVVTCEVPNSALAKTMSAFERAGAVDVHAA